MQPPLSRNLILSAVVVATCMVGFCAAASALLLVAPETQAADAPKVDKQQPLPTLKNTPDWLKTHPFVQTAFTFVRIRYESQEPQRRSLWSTDYPNADLNLARTIGAMTRLDVATPSRVLRLTDAESLAKHPFVYLAEPGRMHLSDAEVKGLRKYLTDGGFLMTDDFWGEQEWLNVEAAMKRVFPEREPQSLKLDHEIFHCVFDLKEKPQVTSVAHYLAGRTTERLDAKEAHYRAIRNDEGRIMVLLCHNTDLADGWERYLDSPKYRREVSEPLAFPMGVNIVFYALKHAPKK